MTLVTGSGSLLRAVVLVLAALLVSTVECRANGADPARVDSAATGASATNGRLQARIDPLEHGWIAVRDHRQQITHLFHLPPRGTGPGLVPAGSLRAVAAVPQAVDGLAASSWGYVVALRDEAIRSADGGTGETAAVPIRQRRVLAQSVISGPGSFYEYPPGRPELLASLPGMPELAGIVTTGSGSFALLRERARGARGSGPDEQAVESAVETAGDGRSPWSLLGLATGSPGAGGGEWKPVALPWSDPKSSARVAPDRDARCWLVPWGEAQGASTGMALLVARDGGEDEAAIEFWIATTPKPASVSGTGSAIDWKLERIRYTSVGSTGVDPAVPDVWVRVRESGVDHLVSAHWLEHPSGVCVIHRWSTAGAVQIAKLEGVPRDAALTPVGRANGAGGIALVWFEEASAAESRGRPQVGGQIPLLAPKRRMVELTLSGRVLYDGGALSGQSGIERELELLAWLLVMTMVGVVVFVLRCERVASVPRGYQPADPLRRLIAAFLDWVPAAAAAGLLTGLSVREAVFPLQVSGGSFEPATVALALAIAWFHTSLSEWLTGRSLGKAAMGLWVVSETADDAKASGSPGKPSPVPTEAVGHDGGAGNGDRGTSPAPSSDVEARHPPLWAAALRNLIRWGAPVVGLFMLIDRSRRHPGDVAGRTVVVQLKPVSDPE